MRAPGRPIALPFPTGLAPALERYLAVHRPVLAALRGRWHQPAGTALWLSAHGSPITEMTFYDLHPPAHRSPGLQIIETPICR